MLNLRDRLRRMVPSDSAITDGKAPMAMVGRTDSELAAQLQRDSPLFQWFVEADGSFLRRTTTFPLSYQHGKACLEGAYQMEKERLLTIYPFLAQAVNGQEPWLHQLLFFDTETTGLSHGSGTLIFLFGCGYFTAEGFQFEQWFLPHWEGEHAFLSAFVERLEAFPVITSFNGKAFDWNLLQTRLLYQRIRLTVRPRQLDLLYMARRLWRKELSNCSLAQIEADKLGVMRHNDVPGREVPERYFKFVNEGESKGLLPVFQHNEWDILSLVTLLYELYGLLPSAQGEERAPTAYEAAALGRLHDERKQIVQAKRFYLGSLQVANERDRSQHRMELAKLYKREGSWVEALRLWQQSIEESSELNLEPYVELAKYYEHQQKDYQKAFTYTWEALNQLKQTGFTTRTVRQEKELIKRLTRLEKKMAVHGER